MRLQRTERAEKVIVIARSEARSAGAEEPDSKHVLLGLVADRENVVAQGLMALGASEQDVRVAIDVVPPEDPHVGDRDAPHLQAGPTWPSLQATLDRAEEEALHRGEERIATAHILLSLVSDPESPCIDILSRLGVNVHNLSEYVASLPADALDVPPTSDAAQQRGSLGYLRPNDMPISETAEVALNRACSGWEHALYISRDKRGMDADERLRFAGAMVATISLLHAVADKLSAAESDNAKTILEELQQNLTRAHMDADRYWSTFNHQ